MNQNITAAAVGRDEAKALLVVEPLDLSQSHWSRSFLDSMCPEKTCSCDTDAFTSAGRAGRIASGRPLSTFISQTNSLLHLPESIPTRLTNDSAYGADAGLSTRGEPNIAMPGTVCERPGRIGGRVTCQPADSLICLFTEPQHFRKPQQFKLLYPLKIMLAILPKWRSPGRCAGTANTGVPAVQVLMHLARVIHRAFTPIH